MIDLDELMRLREAATPGHYTVDYTDHVRIYADPYQHAIARTYGPELNGIGYASMTGENERNNAAYICAACNSVPDLVSRIRELEAQRDWMAQAAANAGWHGVRVGKEYMIDQARIAVSRAQAEQHECPTPEVSCHARDGKLCMSNNHLACAQAVNKKSLKQVSALEPCRIVSNNNSTPPEWIMHRFTEMK